MPKETKTRERPSEGAPVRVLFVCLGNICRSPAAQGVLEQLVREQGLEGRVTVDSAGLYHGHAGEAPDRRMQVHARARGLTLTHRARPVRESDFDRFDLIIAMDDSNYNALRRMAPTVEAERKVHRMAEWISLPGVTYVPDPYYEVSEGFELVLDLLQDGCERLLRQIVTRA